RRGGVGGTGGGWVGRGATAPGPGSAPAACRTRRRIAIPRAAVEAARQGAAGPPAQDDPMPDPAQRPPIAAAPLSLVLVAHNAAAYLGEVLGGWKVVLDGLARPYEIILVDDGSTDETGPLAD